MRSTGNHFETRACQWLQDAGLALLARNYTTRHGEIDLVMLDDHCVVFVEVRFRRRTRCGSAVDSITTSKRDKLIKAAALWLSTHHRYANRPCRFDVVCFDGDADHVRPNWIRSAFDAS